MHVQAVAREEEMRREEDGSNGYVEGGLLQQTSSGGLKKHCLYIDTCSTEDQMVDHTYMTGVHKVKKPLNLHTNAGTSTTNHQGYLGSHLF